MSFAPYILPSIKNEKKQRLSPYLFFLLVPQEYMSCVEGDLSGKKQVEVFLWLKMGQGDGVATSVVIQKAPLNHINPTVAKVIRLMIGGRDEGFDGRERGTIA